MKRQQFQQLARLLKADDPRDVFTALYQWGHATDFTYQDQILGDIHAYLRAFVISRYFDFGFPVSSLTDLKKRRYIHPHEEKEIKEWWTKLDIL